MLKKSFCGLVLSALLFGNASSYTKEDLRRYKKISSIFTVASNLSALAMSTAALGVQSVYGEKFNLSEIPEMSRYFLAVDRTEALKIPENMLCSALDEDKSLLSDLSLVLRDSILCLGSDEYLKILSVNPSSAGIGIGAGAAIGSILLKRVANKILLKRFSGKDKIFKRSVLKVLLNTLFDIMGEHLVLFGRDAFDLDSIRNNESNLARVVLKYPEIIISNFVSEFLGVIIAQGLEKNSSAMTGSLVK